MKFIITKWKKTWYNPDTSQIRPSSKLSAEAIRAIVWSVQEASFDTEGVTELTGRNKRTNVDINNMISSSQIQPLWLSGYRGATSEKG